jgi:RNA polymerase sigma factor (sigma-70 family)
MQLPTILEHLQGRMRPPQPTCVNDAQLLDLFVRQHDPAAFEELMRRHGPMVYAVCRRVLRHVQDVEDAFQTVFLQLARHATSVGKRGSVGGWLYTVAYHLAERNRTRSARRGQMEQPLSEPPIDARGLDPADAAAWRDLRRFLDAALDEVPEKYRTAFVLCHLEGLSCEEAAAHLGCPLGTVQSRVGRARQRLRALLARRGWTPASAPLVELLGRHVSSLAPVSPVLVNATVHSALLLSLGKALGGEAPDSVLALMDQAVGESGRGRWRYLSVLAAALLAVSALAWLLWSFQPGQDSGTADPCHHAPTAQQKE